MGFYLQTLRGHKFAGVAGTIKSIFRPDVSLYEQSLK